MRLVCALLLVACTRSGPCKTSSECDAGRVCAEGVCTVPECASNDDCGTGRACTNRTCVITAICGNGSVETPEACDDGNTSDGDYCAADCAASLGSSGDGIVQPNEACDDGNSVDDDYCSNDRQAARRCGDAMIQSNETCDDGNTVSTDYCSNDCKTARRCGDAMLQSNEACDDGNLEDDDYCAADCARAFVCGDGKRQSAEEQCDEGTTRTTAFCTAGCTAVTGTCGNGAIDPGETCDPSAPEPNTYCHQCKAGTGCLSSGSNACAGQGQESFGTGAGSGATGFTGCLGNAFIAGFDFTTTTDSVRPVLSGEFAGICRDGVTDTPIDRVYYGQPGGCLDYQPFARHQVACPAGTIAAGMRGYETASSDGLTTVGFLVPLCATIAEAKADPPPLNRREPALEQFGPSNLSVVDASVLDDPSTTRSLAAPLATLDAATQAGTARRVDFFCPQGQAIKTYRRTFGCYADALRVFCAALP